MNATYAIANFPTTLTDLTEKLANIAARSHVMSYVYDEGDQCCDEHDTGVVETLYPMDPQDAARILAPAYIEAAHIAPPQINADVIGLLAALFAGNEVSAAATEDLDELLRWVSHVGVPNRDAFEDALTQELFNVSEEEIVVTAKEGTPGARPLINSDESPQWVRPLGEDEAAMIATELFN